MRKQLPFILLGLLAVVQLAVPASMILRYERALSEGTVLKFRTGIYDPYDPFRGRYVRLNFDELNMTDAAEEVGVRDWGSYYNKPVYVLFTPDADGFARVAAVSEEKPQSSATWLHTTVSRNRSSGGASIWVRLPFDKYFMNEKAAPEAERVYIEANRQVNEEGRRREPKWRDDNYALVRILDGTAAMEALIIKGQPIEELLKKPDAKATDAPAIETAEMPE